IITIKEPDPDEIILLTQKKEPTSTPLELAPRDKVSIDAPAEPREQEAKTAATSGVTNWSWSDQAPGEHSDDQQEETDAQWEDGNRRSSRGLVFILLALIIALVIVGAIWLG